MNQLEYYGEQISPYYDDIYPPHGIAELLDYVREIKPAPARIIDFGVGTGRTAIPLARAGYHVHGVDISPAMLAVLDEKDPDQLVEVTRGDFTELDGNGDQDFVLILNSTLFMAPDPASRQRTFNAAARCLRDDGALIIETYSPLHFLRGPEIQHDFAPLGLGRQLHLSKILINGLDQKITIFRTFVTSNGVSTMLEESTFAFPAEIDLQAEEAGFRLDLRTEGWTTAIPRSASESIVTVYRKGKS